MVGVSLLAQKLEIRVSLPCPFQSCLGQWGLSSWPTSARFAKSPGIVTLGANNTSWTWYCLHYIFTMSCLICSCLGRQGPRFTLFIHDKDTIISLWHSMDFLPVRMWTDQEETQKQLVTYPGDTALKPGGWRGTQDAVSVLCKVSVSKPGTYTLQSDVASKSDMGCLDFITWW